MVHNHGSEFQLQIIHEDGTEELSGWMNNQEQLVQEMAAVQRPQSSYWLRQRNVLCPNCLDRGQKIIEYPITKAPSPRYKPHNSSYLLAVGAKSRYELFEIVMRSVQ
jgi:hypothetical protein